MEDQIIIITKDLNMSLKKTSDYDEKHIEELKNHYMSNEELNTENLELKKQLVELENEDKRADTQRRMVWFALFGMLLYPVFIMCSDYFNLDTASNLMSTIAPTYFISASLIVMVFFGAEGVIKILADRLDKKKAEEDE